jgi:hypothetical protein
VNYYALLFPCFNYFIVLRITKFNLITHHVSYTLKSWREAVPVQTVFHEAVCRLQHRVQAPNQFPFQPERFRLQAVPSCDSAKVIQACNEIFHIIETACLHVTLRLKRATTGI